MCEILLMTVTVIKILGLPYATPVSMRWRWSCCSLWRRSWYWWGYPGGCGGQGSSHRGHGATPSDGSRDWCLKRYMCTVQCVVQCLGSWTPSVALGILSDSTVTPSAVKISDLHIFHRWKSDVLNIPDSSVQLVPCERLFLHRAQYPLHQFTFCVIQPFVFRKNYLLSWIEL